MHICIKSGGLQRESIQETVCCAHVCGYLHKCGSLRLLITFGWLFRFIMGIRYIKPEAVLIGQEYICMCAWNAGMLQLDN